MSEVLGPQWNEMQRGLDRLREDRSLANEMGAWQHGSDHMAPLRASNLPAEEHGGFMFMGHETGEHGTTGRQTPTLWAYKHGISRKSVHLDAEGRAYSGEYGRDSTRFWGPTKATDMLRGKGHYDVLHELGSAPATRYDHDYIAGRNARLRSAGWGVMS